MNRLSLVVASCLMLCVSSVSAQSLPSGVGGLDISSSTSDPLPGQQVTLTVRSYAIDIDSAAITWTAGGKTIGRGIGMTSVTVTAPALGKKLTVSISATTPDGQTLENAITLSSGAVDMIMEPDGYTPPFFRGKVMPAYQNLVKVTAIPHLASSAGAEYDPKTLVYSWQQNGTALQSQSGYGRQSISLPGAIVPRPYSLSVTVSTRDGSAQASGRITVEPGEPSIAFYRNDPLYGALLNRAIGPSLYIGSTREAGVLAVPYGFNLGSAGLTYSWSVNGKGLSELSDSQSITLRAPSDQAGQSDVRLTARSGKAILQEAAGGFSAIFGAAGSQPASGI